jgi:hypothetical protein
MNTRELIYFILRVAYSVFIWAGVLYSLYVGVRHGFRFPRPLHIMAVAIVMLEAVVLVVFPLPLSSITALLGSILALLPVSPYIGWVMAGGPTRLNGRYAPRFKAALHRMTALRDHLASRTSRRDVRRNCRVF